MRWGWPSGVTKQAEEMRVLWTWAGVAALAVGALVWGLIFWCCIRYRKKSDVLPRQTKYNLPIEIVYSIAPFFVIAGLFYRTAVVENNVNHLSKNPDVLIRVDAFKWNWQFEYLEDHGKKTVYAADKSTALSTVGSDNEIPVLVVPVHQSVQIIEHSEDVVHSFWVPEFLFKRDVIPYGPDHTSEDNRFQFEAVTEGSYVGRCAELCGTYHSQMNFEVRVVSADTYQKYLVALNKAGEDNPARQSEALQAAGMAPYATTTHPFNTDRTARAPSSAQNPTGD
ncbi:MAG: cytochrome c oxidase subunit II [Jatrophihabitans sp.]|nr:MAG: cytochrome c oxidase subunit II [Jatrophihabitans sp.]